jgi:hypothetical protein
MSKAVVAIIVVVAVVVGGVIFAVSGDDGDDRKASIGAQSKKPDTPPGQAVSNEQAPDRRRGRLAAVLAAVKVRAAEAMQRRIARRAERRGGDESYASYVDPDTGQIVLITDAPPAAVEEVTADSDPDNEKQLDKVKVIEGTIEDTYNRRDDSPAFWGGGGITSAGGICSAGYAAKNSAGAIFSVTAGHCFKDGAAVTTESGALQPYATVSNRRLPSVTGGQSDVELVGGKTYGGRIFTGGVTSATSIPVVGAGAATVGYTAYCHSGRTTGQSCGHTVTSLTGQACTSTGCKSPLIVFTGGNMIQPGDSGGTFYSTDSTSAWIRGNVIAASTDGSTGYAMPWTTIAQELGLSIVTG